MEKLKLKQARMRKGFTQQDMADLLSMDVANYNRRENGSVKLSISQWEKLAEKFAVPMEDIYEEDGSQVFICNDNASGNYQGTNNIYSVPEFLLSTQQKYIQKLEERVAELEMLLSKK
jgi:DNA-binding XRE family transcriptional regulator